MSIIADRRRQQSQPYGEGTARAVGTTRPHGNVTDAVLVPNPIHAEIQNERVRVIAFGNVEGFSPGALVTDEAGDTLWVPLEELRITDPNYRPMTR
jgi:hypothetical protein